VTRSTSASTSSSEQNSFPTQPSLCTQVESFRLFSRGLLSITGRLERPQCERKEGSYLFRGARFGEFARELQVPRDIKENEIKAYYDNGVMQVQIPEPKGESSHCTVWLTGAARG
jgi:hypothetical protein